MVYPILVEIPWKKIFEPEKYLHEQANIKKLNLSDSQTENSFENHHKDNNSHKKNPQEIDEIEPIFGHNFPTEEMIRLSVPDDEIELEDFGSLDEMELLRLIPEIVDQMREGRVTREEKIMLRSIFGELWPLLEDEARRDPRRQMNPILRAIFNSREIQMTSLARTRKARSTSNDYMWNSLSIIDHAPRTNLRQKRHDPKTKPSARLMETVAMLVRESLKGYLKSPHDQRRKKRLQMNPQAFAKKEIPQVFEDRKASPEHRFFYPKSQAQ